MIVSKPSVGGFILIMHVSCYQHKSYHGFLQTDIELYSHNYLLGGQKRGQYWHFVDTCRYNYIKTKRVCVYLDKTYTILSR